MNSLLKETLSNYVILNPEVEFIRHNENETYKVKDTMLNKEYVLRVHKPSEDLSLEIFGDSKYSLEFLTNEITILDSISKNTKILAQVPVKNKQGDFITILNNGTPATLLTWINGKTIDKVELTHEVLFGLGEMLGEFHSFSKECLHKGDFKRYAYDEKFLNQMSFTIIKGVKSKSISSEQFVIIENSIDEIRKLMDELNLQRSSKGIVHFDLAKSNLILNDNGQISPIDFGLCGYGYYYMDIGSLFNHFNESNQQRSIMKGYEKVINEEIEMKYIEGFMVFQIILFICTHIETAHKLDWFNNAIKKWSENYFIPFNNKRGFLLDI